MLSWFYDNGQVCAITYQRRVEVVKDEICVSERVFSSHFSLHFFFFCLRERETKARDHASDKQIAPFIWNAYTFLFVEG